MLAGIVFSGNSMLGGSPAEKGIAVQVDVALYLISPDIPSGRPLPGE
jgi:hypothetical protein